MTNKKKTKRKYRKPVSFYPLKPEDVIRASLQADPVEVDKKMEEQGIIRDRTQKKKKKK